MSAPVVTVSESGTSNLLLAGEMVAAGVYRDVETGRVAILAEFGPLPAACDGRVAAYEVRRPTWGEMVKIRSEKAKTK